MSSDQYTPSEAHLRIAWADHSQGMDPRAEFDRFLAGVKRDAAREALAPVEALLEYAEMHGNPEVWTHDLRTAVGDDDKETP